MLYNSKQILLPHLCQKKIVPLPISNLNFTFTVVFFWFQCPVPPQKMWYVHLYQHMTCKWPGTPLTKPTFMALCKATSCFTNQWRNGMVG